MIFFFSSRDQILEPLCRQWIMETTPRTLWQQPGMISTRIWGRFFPSQLEVIRSNKNSFGRRTWREEFLELRYSVANLISVQSVTSHITLIQILTLGFAAQGGGRYWYYCTRSLEWSVVLFIVSCCLWDTLWWCLFDLWLHAGSCKKKKWRIIYQQHADFFIYCALLCRSTADRYLFGKIMNVYNLQFPSNR